MFIEDLKRRIDEFLNSFGIGNDLFIIIVLVGVISLSFYKLENWAKLTPSDRMMYIIWLMTSVTALIFYILFNIFLRL